MNPAVLAHTLADWPLGQPARLVRVIAPQTDPALAIQLADLGFLPGEFVQPLHAAPLGGGARVVRIGASTFALRAAEARCIEVDTWAEAGTASPRAPA